ncbi:MAG: hypothetical protein AMJ78_04275 [Omnitrophica WOR_2 bacterium SM23_29]|nr:MAG: hypothetical protein AMJ78_04275 [Omnitrophica WOR_2 bacterium SM23_29]
MKMDPTKLEFIKGEVRYDEPMSRHTWFKIGGPADVWVAPNGVEDLLNILRYARDNGVDTFILGDGSKLLVGDKGVRGFVIVLRNPSFRCMKFEGEVIDLGCGTKISEFLSGAMQHGLGGCEFLAGLPGTIGGALIMNAGSPSNGIGDFAEEVIAIKDVTVTSLKKGQIEFSYRNAGLNEFILLGARLRLVSKDVDEIQAQIDKNLSRKRQTQDLSYPSVGCIFKNPSESILSGRLIERSGFKGYSIGDACVSIKHANFILNRGSAKASDVLRLIDEIQKKVFNDHGIMLELEVKLIGEFNG